MHDRQPDPPHDPESILARIQAIELEMVAIQRIAVTQSADLRIDWDALFAERTALEMKLWTEFRLKPNGPDA